jgi:hypothetical protein
MGNQQTRQRRVTRPQQDGQEVGQDAIFEPSAMSGYGVAADMTGETIPSSSPITSGQLPTGRRRALNGPHVLSNFGDSVRQARYPKSPIGSLRFFPQPIA